jgi:hypothetical protein
MQPNSMMKLIDTEGQEHNEVLLDHLIRIVEQGNQAEWEGYSGQAGLYWYSKEGDKRIIFTPGGSDSYLLQYYDDTDGLDYYFVSLGSEESDSYIEVSVGGDPWRIPNYLFISKQKTIETLSFFYKNKIRNPSVAWLESYKINWPEE